MENQGNTENTETKSVSTGSTTTAQVITTVTENEVQPVTANTKTEVVIDEDDIKEDIGNAGEERPVNTALKVKADPPDISPEDRKRNVKKLAGAISHSLRNNGEVNVRCFGSASIGKAAKAIAIARDYISSQNLSLSCSPGFITTKMGENELTGINFGIFSQEKTDVDNIDIEKCKSVLMVKADPKDISPDDKRSNVKRLAGAIAHSLEENREVVIRCFGNATIGKAAKALAIARGFTANRGADLYCWPKFIVANMQGNERTGIAWVTFSNEI